MFHFLSKPTIRQSYIYYLSPLSPPYNFRCVEPGIFPECSIKIAYLIPVPVFKEKSDVITTEAGDTL